MSRRRIEVPDKHCLYCGKAFNRNVVTITGKLEDVRLFRKRKHCPRACHLRSLSKRPRTAEPPPKPVDPEEVLLYTDSPEFQEYADRVRKVVVRKGKRGATTADIHRALGHGNQRWTLDALAVGYDERGAMPTRWIAREI